MNISYNPQVETDSEGNPIGLSTIWNLSGVSTTSETVTIVLHHEPNKNAAGVSGGDIEKGGETDIEVTFQLEVQP